MRIFPRTPLLIKYLFPRLIFNFPKTGKTIYLTFDDGPIPETTRWILDTLKQYQAKATFFCVGENVVKHQQLFQEILDEGHSVGNHTFNHLNNWKVNNREYLKNVEKAAQHIDSKLFRPPYGKLNLKTKRILQRKYKLILWDILSRDYDRSLPKEKCLNNVIANVRNGSIIVFHDSIKAQENMQYALPKVLEYFHAKGFQFQAIKF